MSKLTQCSKIIHLLKKYGRKGVPNYKFPQYGILRYSARIAELRSDGYTIDCIREYHKGRATGVFRYYLGDDNNE